MLIVVVIVTVVLLLVSQIIFSSLSRWLQITHHKKGLPPGDMGWPIFGETIGFLKHGPNFMKNHKERYGSFFKSHLLGSPTIVSMEASLNRYILMNEAKGLVPGYPKSMIDILGKYNLSAVHGPTHKNMRSALLTLISSSMIKDQLLLKIDDFMRTHLRTWKNNTIIDIQQELREMTFQSSLYQIASAEFSRVSQYILPEFLNLVVGTISLPIYLPSTNYYRGLLARRNIKGMFREIMEKRRAMGEECNDMLGLLMSREDHKYRLSDEEIVDQVITILYSTFETVSVTSKMAVKYLHDHPRALQELREEHFGIREHKGTDDPLNASDMKAMVFTRAIILETLRLATVVNGVLRKTTREMELNGFVIPKGWRIYLYTRDANYDPAVFDDSFNPWRWLDKQLDGESLFSFGVGSRKCPGKELGIAEISTFLHYFVTRYRWEEVGEVEIRHFPRVEAPHGLNIMVSTYQLM